MKKIRVLIVEDEFITGMDLRRRLEKAGLEVPAVVDTGQKAIDTARELRPDIVLMDITLREEMTGLASAKEITARYNIPVIYLTSHSDEGTIDEALQTEMFGYLVKPVDDRALRTTIQVALYRHAMERRLRESEERYRLVASHVDEGIWIIDPQGKVIYQNARAADICTLPADPAQELTITGILPSGACREISGWIQDVLTSGSPVRKEMNLDLLAVQQHLEISLYPFSTPESGIINIILISRILPPDAVPVTTGAPGT